MVGANESPADAIAKVSGSVQDGKREGRPDAVHRSQTHDRSQQYTDYDHVRSESTVKQKWSKLFDPSRFHHLF